eukprot:CAMPEP_0201720740 /NCGR_PEP_ID=MMETSP0593-20130828/5590_1 /ASSEMBLY_ACC=CAM_ASM_000672 /TAXON_ID=267983 /ORGANISM="Skeletonema japonicum, Strain CCMP2506" /LENGTH=336 /DNA_ID=CAMNT_0048211419 /DNA_START=74 /DNA_END=1084 /DNA_ORIENTATION=+
MDASPGLIVFAIGSDIDLAAFVKLFADFVDLPDVVELVVVGEGTKAAEGPAVSQSGRKHASVAMHNHSPPEHSHSRELNVSPQHDSSPLAHVAPSSGHLPFGTHSKGFATGANVGRFVGEAVGESMAATGDGVGPFVGEEVGGSVDAIGAGVGLFVGEVVGESVAATGDGVGTFVGEEEGGSVDATGAGVGLFVGEGTRAAEGVVVSQSGRRHASVKMHNHSPPEHSHSRELNVSPQHDSSPLAHVAPSSGHLPFGTHSIEVADVGMFVGEIGGAALQNAGLAPVWSVRVIHPIASPTLVGKLSQEFVYIQPTRFVTIVSLPSIFARSDMSTPPGT